MTPDARLEYALQLALDELAQQRAHRKVLEARITRQRAAGRGMHESLARYRGAMLRMFRVVEEIADSPEPRSYMSAYTELSSVVREFFYAGGSSR